MREANQFGGAAKRRREPAVGSMPVRGEDWGAELSKVMKKVETLALRIDGLEKWKTEQSQTPTSPPVQNEVVRNTQVDALSARISQVMRTVDDILTGKIQLKVAREAKSESKPRDPTPSAGREPQRHINTGQQVSKDKQRSVESEPQEKILSPAVSSVEELKQLAQNLAGKGMWYTVQKGDTISGIAQRLSLNASDVLAFNPTITDQNLISVGQLLAIPTLGLKAESSTSEGKGDNTQLPGSVPSKKKYTVKPGDTLTSIAAQRNVSVDQIEFLNEGRLKDPDMLLPGKRIFMPKRMASGQRVGKDIKEINGKAAHKLSAAASGRLGSSAEAAGSSSSTSTSAPSTSEASEAEPILDVHSQPNDPRVSGGDFSTSRMSSSSPKVNREGSIQSTSDYPRNSVQTSTTQSGVNRGVSIRPVSETTTKPFKTKQIKPPAASSGPSAHSKPSPSPEAIRTPLPVAAANHQRPEVAEKRGALPSPSTTTLGSKESQGSSFGSQKRGSGAKHVGSGGSRVESTIGKTSNRMPVMKGDDRDWGKNVEQHKKPTWSSGNQERGDVSRKTLPSSAPSKEAKPATAQTAKQGQHPGFQPKQIMSSVLAKTGDQLTSPSQREDWQEQKPRSASDRPKRSVFAASNKAGTGSAGVNRARPKLDWTSSYRKNRAVQMAKPGSTTP